MIKLILQEEFIPAFDAPLSDTICKYNISDQWQGGKYVLLNAGKRGTPNTTLAYIRYILASRRPQDEKNMSGTCSKTQQCNKPRPTTSSL